MKKFLLLMVFCSMMLSSMADQLVLIETTGFTQTKILILNPLIKAHYYQEKLVIATIESPIREKYTVLQDNPWNNGLSYYVVYTHAGMMQEYANTISGKASLLYTSDNLLVVGIDESKEGQLQPAKNDGMVRLFNKAVRLAESSKRRPVRLTDPDPFVLDLINQVDAANLTATVQHLQDYGTRNAYQPASIEAQNWIAGQFEALGLSVEIMNFSMPGGNASDNVIATMQGTVYPDEYVICGSHYDSYSNSGLAPGADDNASGTAAVIELARILSQYTFDRTIVFCTFSGEEYGLYGSEAYASRCADQNMDIQGYFNLDMIGYLQDGSPIHTDLIYPPSAQELADFYTDVCATYLPDFLVETGVLIGGDSDHTSFNNNGFMGIFPFEDGENYSPYIHTSNDNIGPSYNNETQAGIFAQASLASVITLANRLNPPRNLIAFPGDNQVELNWDTMEGIDHFIVYRDNVAIASPESNQYLDADVINEISYTYYITAIYSESGDESDASNSATVTPMPPLSLPFFTDFESGTAYWETSQGWGLSSSASHSSSHSLADSPTGQYGNNVESYASLRAFSLEGDYDEVTISFWNKFDLEADYDYVWLEISTDGISWTQLAEFNGVQSGWQKKTYELNAYIGEPHVQLRFHFMSDVYVTGDGIYIDDFEISRVITGLEALKPALSIYPNPAHGLVYVQHSGKPTETLLLFDVYGNLVRSWPLNGRESIDVSGLAPGIYFLRPGKSEHQGGRPLMIR
ncbi:MAG: M28 family peptidase [Bacteroidales bacterium]|nr:M28 family peptidase [Bacteroidales bacterium]